MVDVGGFTFENMCDSKLKVTMLYEVMSSHFPPEKHPSPKPLQLSSAIAVIRRGRLLSECKRDDIWKAAFDVWNERVLSYVDSEMPDKCWAGICMLGVTCQECHSQRFLESYQSWYQKLIIHLKLPNESPFLKVAACASLSDLLSRLGGFPSMKKEGTSLAGKLVQPILQLLGEDGSETIWSNAADLFCAVLKSFPSSFQSHYDNVESVLVSKIFSGKCSLRICQPVPLMEKAALNHTNPFMSQCNYEICVQEAHMLKNSQWILCSSIVQEISGGTLGLFQSNIYLSHLSIFSIQSCSGYLEEGSHAV